MTPEITRRVFLILFSYTINNNNNNKKKYINDKKKIVVGVF